MIILLGAWRPFGYFLAYAVFLHYHYFSSMNHIFTKIVAQIAWLVRTEKLVRVSPEAESVLICNSPAETRNTLSRLTLCRHANQKQKNGRPESPTGWPLFSGLLSCMPAYFKDVETLKVITMQIHLRCLQKQ